MVFSFRLLRDILHEDPQGLCIRIIGLDESLEKG
jgi:hypothetical protein